jgi:hypothetical protein
MIKKAIASLVCALLYCQAFAQQTPLQFNINGFVYEKSLNGDLVPLSGSHVLCIENQQGTVTSETGFFSLQTPELPTRLVASFVGYDNDTIKVENRAPVNFVLQAQTLLEVSLLDKRKSNTKSLIEATNVEWISTEELHKAACCNLSESFVTNPSVDVNFTDALTGAKQIQMLGLDGVYAQVLFENKPFLRGLSASYGLNFLPGTWIESIQISKGTGSVVNGFESLSGQINVELYKPQKAPSLLWNTYLNSVGLLENNFVVAPVLDGDWKTVVLGHHSYLGQNVDSNNDNFLDDPKTDRLSLMNRWEYVGFDNRHIELGLRYLTEDKEGGQYRTDNPETEAFEFKKPYEVRLKTEQLEAHAKTGFVLDESGTSIGLMSTIRQHQQSALFGTSQYTGEQQSLYFNAIYQSYFGCGSKQLFKGGLSYYRDDYQELLQLRQLSELNLERKDRTFGVFGELQYKPVERFCSTIGVRADRTQDHGTWYSPRVHLRYNPVENAVVRASAGKAYRYANVFAENSSYFFSSRTLEMTENSLVAEEAWNYGLNFTYNTYLFGKETTFNADYYQTDFLNRVVFDLEESSHIKIYNLNGSSFSKSLQLDASFEPFEGWEVKYAHKWNETKTTYSLEKEAIAVPFVPKYRSVTQLSYSAWQNRWSVNLTVQHIGPSRVPAENTEAKANPSYWSSKFQLVSAQYTRRFKRLEWYLGIENALNYLQENPIRNVDDPYGEGFDAAMIWGPTHGRKVYSGIRFLVNE